MTEERSNKYETVFPQRESPHETGGSFQHIRAARNNTGFFMAPLKRRKQPEPLCKTPNQFFQNIIKILDN
jgi:hypothetical protein